MMSSQNSLMAFLCDPAGTISQVLRDDFKLASRLTPGQTWTMLFDAASLDKALLFFEQVNEKKFSAGWELNVRLKEEVAPLHFSGGRVAKNVLIVGASNTDAVNRFYEDEILAMNNEQANIIRSLMKEKSFLENNRITQDIMLDDAAKLNNELVTLQRKMAKVNRDLEQKQHLLESIMETMPDFLYTIDLVNSKLLFSNRKIGSMLGYAPEEDVEGESIFFEALLHHDDLAQLPVRLEKYKQVDDESVVETEYRLKHVSGAWHWFRSRDMVFERSEDGSPTQILGIAQDITVYKLLQEKLWTLSTRDALTGLYNRNYFDNELERLKNSRQLPVSIVMMDINDLKLVNDEKGHAAGDRLLRSAADVFSKAFRTGDVVARVGGDEFAVLLPKTDADTIKPVLRRITGLIKEHNQTRKHESVLSVAIGHATAEQPEQLLDSLKQADEKMYADKAGFKIERVDKKKTNKENTDALKH